MNAELFVNHLSQITFNSVFNPYRDICDEHDHSESPAIRRLNLTQYLNAAVNCGVESVWLGRDCGYRGARRTGIAVTDEITLATLDYMFGISGLAKATIGEPVKERTATEVWEDHMFGISGLAKATIGEPVKERTATEVWKIIREIDAKVFLWNIFPFHPFEAENPMSNRRHSAREFNECKELLCYLLEWLQPKMIVAIGADAHKALSRLEFKVSPVRHPSYGGNFEFADGIRQLYST